MTRILDSETASHTHTPLHKGKTQFFERTADAPVIFTSSPHPTSPPPALQQSPTENKQWSHLPSDHTFLSDHHNNSGAMGVWSGQPTLPPQGLSLRASSLTLLSHPAELAGSVGIDTSAVVTSCSCNIIPPRSWKEQQVNSYLRQLFVLALSFCT